MYEHTPTRARVLERSGLRFSPNSVGRIRVPGTPRVPERRGAPHALRTLVLALGLCFMPSGASAQIEFAFGRGIGDFHGEYVDGHKLPSSLGAELRFSLDRVTQVGLEVARAAYPIRDGEFEGSQVNVFGVVRRFSSAEGARLFYGGKLGYARETAYTDFFQGTISAVGISGGPTAGLQFSVGGVKLEAAVDLLYNAFSDPYSGQIAVDGQTDSRFRWGSRIGLAVPFGGY